MSNPLPASLVRAALLAAGLALAAAAAQATDFTTVIGTCSPGSASALQYDLKLTNGAVTKPGRNPPSRHLYFCGVPPIDDLAASTQIVLQLQYSDQNVTGNGHVTAQLMRKRLSTGAATTVARVASVPSTRVRTVEVALPGPLDFSIYAYFLVVGLDTDSLPVTAHRVTLKTVK